MSDLQKVEKRGARWACNSVRRIREWEVQSGGHPTNYLGDFFVIGVVRETSEVVRTTPQMVGI